ncbi:hypothetical protein TNCV_3171161 [Trichonephila clavipes]|nr:hypothetical protein TNCV_3171161 [Trichonephila clavipes]
MTLSPLRQIRSKITSFWNDREIFGIDPSFESNFRATQTSRNTTARVIERNTSGEICCFLEDSNGFRMVHMVAKNDANLALPPRFPQVLIESPL